MNLSLFPSTNRSEVEDRRPRHSKARRVPRMAFVLLVAAYASLGRAGADGAGMKEPEGMQIFESRVLPAPPFEPVPGGMAGIGGGIVAAGADVNGAELWFSKDKGASWERTGVRMHGDFAMASRDASVFLIFGSSSPTPSSRVLEVSRQESSGKWAERELPPLPGHLSNPVAAVVGGVLYVLGSASETGGAAAAESAFYSLDLRAPLGWKAEYPLPAGILQSPTATTQYDMFCVFGVEPGTGATATWLYRPRPLEGTKEKGWREGRRPPSLREGGSAAPLGQSQVLLVGGSPEPSHPLLYNTVTDAWSVFSEVLPLSNPALLRTAESVVVLGIDASGKPAALEMILKRSVRNLVWIDYAVIAGYFVLLTGIGLLFSRQESSLEFSLGNRSVKWWAAGISMFATGASAISFMAIPALAFSTNLVWLFPLIVFIPAYFVTAYFIFPLLRRLEITSTYEYLERRFNRTLRLIASLQCILFQTVAKASVVLVLPALAISSVTGMNVFLSVIIMGVITTIYTAIGGFEAVIWTEVFQAVLMLLAPLAIIFISISSLPGGTGEFIEIGRAMHKFDFALVTWDVAVPAFWILMTMQFVTVTVSVAGDQPVIQRVFSAPLKEVRKVNAMSTACGILIGVMVNLMGLAIFAYFHTHPWKFEPTAQNDQVVPMFIAQAMPVGVAGMMIAAIFAASMSTVASVMNSVATIFTEDFFMRFRPAATDRQRLICLKTSSYVVGTLGTCMALVLAAMDLKSMMVVWSQLGALLGGGIVGVYTLGMFTRRANGFGAIGGALFSIAVTAAVKAWTPLHWGTYLPIAIFSCIGAGYLLSLLRPSSKNLAGLTIFTKAGSKAQPGSRS